MCVRPAGRPAVTRHVTLLCHALSQESIDGILIAETIGIGVSQHAESIFDGFRNSREVFDAHLGSVASKIYVTLYVTLLCHALLGIRPVQIATTL